MKRTALRFTAPRRVEVCREPMDEPRRGEILVETELSAVSAGTEILVYRGLAPAEMDADSSIASLPGSLAFPLKYGYSAVGRVRGLGPDGDPWWMDRLVFSFQPHQSWFTASPDQLFPVPEGASPESAVFLPNMETALNLVLDGRPMAGERVAVLGQGIVGLLTTALLGRFPLEELVTLVGYSPRRKWSRTLGASATLDPASEKDLSDLARRLGKLGGADLVYELSGNPEALDTAVALSGFSSRIVVGSWYGRKRASVDLGGRFHRERIRLVGSQVSTIAPELAGRWDKKRRMETAWRWIERLGPERLVTRRFPLERAAEAYRLLDEDPSEQLQVIFDHKEASCTSSP